MDENNKPTGADDTLDTQGLKDEGIDILGGSPTAEDGSDLQAEVPHELTPVFPEDTNQGGSIKENLEEEEPAPQTYVPEPIAPMPVPPKPVAPSIPTPPPPTYKEPINEMPKAPEMKPPQPVMPAPRAFEPLPQSIAPKKIVPTMPKPVDMSETGAMPVPEAHNDPSIKSIRTFKSDTEEAIQHQHMSVASMVVAETKKRDAAPIEYETEKRHVPWLTIILSLVLVALGGGGLYYVYTLKSAPTEAPAQQETVIPSILKSDKQIEFAMESAKDPIPDFVDIALKAQGTVGSVVYIYPTAIVSGAKGLVTSKDFFTAAGVSMPDRLLRSLAPEFMLGAYIFDGTAPFIILKNTFYQNTYSGMLEWEKNMLKDLGSLVLADGQEKILKTSFEDMVVRNKDVRTLKTEEGVPALMYVFINQETVLVTTNQKALEELIDKMTATRVVQ